MGRTTLVVPLVVQPGRAEAVPLGVQLQPQVVLGVPETVERCSHPVVPLGVQPVEHTRNDAEGVVALGSQLLRHIGMILVLEMILDQGVSLVILVNMFVKLSLQASTNLLAKELDKSRQKAKETGKKQGKGPIGGAPVPPWRMAGAAVWGAQWWQGGWGESVCPAPENAIAAYAPRHNEFGEVWMLVFIAVITSVITMFLVLMIICMAYFFYTGCARKRVSAPRDADPPSSSASGGAARMKDACTSTR